MHTCLRKLIILNFKNYEEASLEFDSKINCFVGNNGIGKTNILDAIYYLSLCKSFFSGTDHQNLKHNQEFFVIQGEYLRQEQPENIYCGVKIGQRKVFRRNGKEYERLSNHLGLIPVVMISPSDSSLILEGSEVRRKFIDVVLSQFDNQYLEYILRYNRALVQRNQILKDSEQNVRIDSELLNIWNEQLINNGNFIFEKRKSFINSLIPVFQHYYDFISDGTELVDLKYHSQLSEESYTDLLEKSIDRDLKFQFTTTGIHKDDLLLQLGNYPIKRIGSQGQQKTYLVALKLAQFDFIKMQSKLHPILLMDDIFDKFDESRVNKIIQLVSSSDFGQIFISDTSVERMGGILEKIGTSYRLFHIQADGIIKVIR